MYLCGHKFVFLYSVILCAYFQVLCGYFLTKEKCTGTCLYAGVGGLVCGIGVYRCVCREEGREVAILTEATFTVLLLQLLLGYFCHSKPPAAFRILRISSYLVSFHFLSTSGKLSVNIFAIIYLFSLQSRILQSVSSRWTTTPISTA